MGLREIIHHASGEAKMISIIADTHTHTISSGHAYSSIGENAAAAALKGLKFLATTDHAPVMEGGPTQMHFMNLKIIPRFLSGVMILKGVELNILDFEGNVDFSPKLLEQMEWVIASLHTPVIKPGTEKQNTQVWIKVAQNPLIDVIGHCGDPRYSFELKPAIKEFATTGKIVEINAHSFTGRAGSSERCRQIAWLCAEYNVPIVVSSDAHIHTRIGRFGDSVHMLEEIGFPEELILNADYDRFLGLLRKKTGKQLTDEE